MPKLDNLIRWQEYAPDIGANREAERPFFLLLAVGLTKQDLAKLAALSESPSIKPPEGAPSATPEELVAKQVEALAAELSPFVHMGSEPLFVAGEAIDTLQKLLMLYTRIAAGSVALLEVVAALTHFNSAGGAVELFYARLSGGSVGTTDKKRAAR